MSNAVMPMRFNIIKQLMQNADGMTPTKLYEILKPEYQNERQCSVEEMDRQMMSLEIVGLVEIAKTCEKEDGSIESAYKITAYGAARAKKYIKKYL